MVNGVGPTSVPLTCAYDPHLHSSLRSPTLPGAYARMHSGTGVFSPTSNSQGASSSSVWSGGSSVGGDDFELPMSAGRGRRRAGDVRAKVRLFVGISVPAAQAGSTCACMCDSDPCPYVSMCGCVYQ